MSGETQLNYTGGRKRGGAVMGKNIIPGFTDAIPSEKDYGKKVEDPEENI